MIGKGEQIDLETGEIGLHSTPTVTKDVIVVGSSFREGLTVKTTTTPRASCAPTTRRSGKLVWQFNTIPRPGEFGNDTWEKESSAINGNTGVWTQISVDEELGIVYLPVEEPTSDLYGGHRPGQQPVCREPRVRRSEDRPAQVALPVRAPSDLGLRPAGSAADRRHRRGRQADQGRRASRPSRASSTSSIA